MTMNTVDNSLTSASSSMAPVAWDLLWKAAALAVFMSLECVSSYTIYLREFASKWTEGGGDVAPWISNPRTSLYILFVLFVFTWTRVRTSPDLQSVMDRLVVIGAFMYGQRFMHDLHTIEYTAKKEYIENTVRDGAGRLFAVLPVRTDPFDVYFIEHVPHVAQWTMLVTSFAYAYMAVHWGTRAWASVVRNRYRVACAALVIYTSAIQGHGVLSAMTTRVPWNQHVMSVVEPRVLYDTYGQRTEFRAADAAVSLWLMQVLLG